jgi:putative transposase
MTFRFNDFNNAYTRLFITIVTKERIRYLGNIEACKMIYSNTGKIVHDIWQNIDFNRQDIIRDVFVIMPEHLHSIIWLKTDLDFTINNNVFMNKGEVFKIGRIDNIIKAFKSTVTKQARECGDNIKWQRGYHCRIISSNQEYENKKDYIRKNPERY